MTPKPILFCDFDGTLCHNRYWSSLPSQQYEKVQKLLFRGDKTRTSDWMRGKYSAEEINGWLAEQIDIPYEILWGLFVQDCQNMKVAQTTLEKLSSLRDRFTVILITGNMDSFSRFTVPALRLEKYFDYISNSYYEGRHKTDNGGLIFKEYSERVGTPLSECVVLDDSQRVCDTFESLGGIAYRITAEKDVNYYLSQF